MDIERFTLKAQDAIDRACRLAVKGEHRTVTPARKDVKPRSWNAGLSLRFFSRS